jgi:hypothetical protein
MPTEVSDSSPLLSKEIAYIRLGTVILFISPVKQKLGSFIGQHVIVKLRIAILFIVV